MSVKVLVSILANIQYIEFLYIPYIYRHVMQFDDNDNYVLFIYIYHNYAY